MPRLQHITTLLTKVWAVRLLAPRDRAWRLHASARLVDLSPPMFVAASLLFALSEQFSVTFTSSTFTIEH